MSFQTNELQPRGNKRPDQPQQKKIDWLYLRPGNYQIRVLESNYKSVYTHWINGINVLCLGDDCPICADNQRIIAENPDNFRDVEGFNGYRVTCYVNVLDRTLVKVCPNDSVENYRNEINEFSPTCYKCNASLINIQPSVSNKVKVFSRSSSVFRQLADISEQIKETTGMELTGYDITIAARKNPTGKGTTVTLIPQPHINDKIENLEPFDLDRASIRLSVEEIRELQRGISLRDIFSARRAIEEPQQGEVEIPFGEGTPTSNAFQEQQNKLSQEAEEFLKRFK